MNIIDILIIALVVVIVVTRFTKFKLPSDPRDKAARKSDLSRLQSLFRDDEPTKSRPGEPVDITPVTEATTTPLKTPPKPKSRLTPKDVQHLPGLEQIKAMEPDFSEENFLMGARSAYELYVQAWNARDEQALENLTAPALTARLLGEMEARSYQPLPTPTFTSTTIDAARLHGKTAVVEVIFEGTEAETPFRRRWTLARPVGSDDPNWDVQSMNDLPPRLH